MRRGAVGVGPLIAALEFAHRNEVPAAEWDSPAVRALTEMVIAVVALDNDRQSIVKELRLGQTEQNVFTALMGEGLSLEEAIAEATASRDRVFCRFLQVEEQTRRGGSAALRRYPQGLRWAIRGNAEWGLTIPGTSVTVPFRRPGPLPSTSTGRSTPLGTTAGRYRRALRGGGRTSPDRRVRSRRQSVPLTMTDPTISASSNHSARNGALHSVGNSSVGVSSGRTCSRTFIVASRISGENVPRR
ncbi:hypothetical protein SAMN04488000_105170 [Lentzea albida]|uniref:Uncharacterized protein n=2 Tax=Lentzea albida TaxID=65499 RepID=A0A1H9K539_9PSEU|nr:hypothetical protein SAMN04488000_105170 [Lentzea albida]